MLGFYMHCTNWRGGSNKRLHIFIDNVRNRLREKEAMTRPRSEFSKATKKQAYERCKDQFGIPRCENCSAPLRPGQFEYDHKTEDFFDGGNELENCLVLCKTCHKLKTGERRPVIDKTRRQSEKHTGAKKSKGFYRPPGMRYDWSKGRYVRF